MSTWVHDFVTKFFSRDELTFWLWLAACVVFSDVLYRFWERCRTTTSRESYTHTSAVLDYKLLLADRLITGSIIGPMLVSALALGRWGAEMLGAQFGPGPGWQPTLTVLIAFAGVRLLLFDIGHYISHFIQHHVPLFWEFHKVHHSAEVLTPVTAYRSHPLEAVLDSVFQGPLQAMGIAGFSYLFGADQSFMTFVGMNAVVFPFFFIGNLQHSHVWISYGPALEHVFSSPAQHQIHHSTAPQHLNKNLAQYFSFIDWIGGTLYVPPGVETLEFGLRHGPDAELKTVRGAYWVPVRRAFHGLLRTKPAAAHLETPVRQ